MTYPAITHCMSTSQLAATAARLQGRWVEVRLVDGSTHHGRLSALSDTGLLQVREGAGWWALSAAEIAAVHAATKRICHLAPAA